MRVGAENACQAFGELYRRRAARELFCPHMNNNNTERSMGAARNKTTLIIINNLACCMCVCYGMHNEFVWRITPSFFGESARAPELDII